MNQAGNLYTIFGMVQGIDYEGEEQLLVIEKKGVLAQDEEGAKEQALTYIARSSGLRKWRWTSEPDVIQQEPSNQPSTTSKKVTR